MPRFHFDLREDGVVLRDEEGEELVDDRAAERQAIETASALARDSFPSRAADQVLVEVRRECSEPIITVVVALKVNRV